MSEGEVMARERGEPGEGKDGHGRPPDRLFEIHVGNEALEFRELKMADPVPTARQIIEAAGEGGSRRAGGDALDHRQTAQSPLLLARRAERRHRRVGDGAQQPCDAASGGEPARAVR